MQSAAFKRWTGIPTLGVIAVSIAALCAMPYLAVLLAAFQGTTETLTHLADTVLAKYAFTTLTLVMIVSSTTFAIGVSAAWLVVMTEFPGRRLLEVVLVIPMAFPPYVIAYAYTHLLDHPGIVQATLREAMGWGPRDYWFPEIRSLGGAAAMLTLVLYPYVYLLARAGFIGQGAAAFLTARSLGRGSLRSFLSVSLPMARPAVAAGVLLVSMETIADFGTVSYFGVQTFATGIYSSWFSMADRAAAAQLALGLLAFALCFALLERLNRGATQYHSEHRQGLAARIELHGGIRWAATAFCSLPAALGALLPAISLTAMALGSEQNLLSSRYIEFIGNSLTVAGVGAAATVAAAVALGTFQRIYPGRLSLSALLASRLGYAVPGGVVAVGLMVPFAAMDNSLDAFMRDRFGISTGLLLTGSIWVLVTAYMIRFLAAAIGAFEGGMAAVSLNMDAASRVLGRGPYGTLRHIHMPMLAPSLVTAALIVFVDIMKELPATLIMRPFNFDTLAVQAFRLASDERLEGAAVPSLVLAMIGLVPVVLLCRNIIRRWT